MSFRLFVDSSTGVDVFPNYDIKETGKKIESRNRSRTGKEYVYKWGAYDIVTFTVTFVDSSFKSMVNSWWGDNVELLWMELGGTEVTSVHLSNKSKPIDALHKPYNDLFKGKIELGTY